MAVRLFGIVWPLCAFRCCELGSGVVYMPRHSCRVVKLQYDETHCSRSPRSSAAFVESSFSDFTSPYGQKIDTVTMAVIPIRRSLAAHRQLHLRIGAAPAGGGHPFFPDALHPRRHSLAYEQGQSGQRIAAPS
jgi:hypothetical protein